MQIDLRRLQRSVGITFVFVTHDQEVALTLSDRIAVMEGGDVLQVDTPSNLYERPVSRKVASFIGNMNFFDARVGQHANGQAILDVAGLGTLQVACQGDSRPEGAQICVAIRPERLKLHDAPPTGPNRAVQAAIKTTTYLGERSHHRVHIPGYDQPVSVSAQNTGRFTPDTAAQKKPVWVR